MKRSDSDVEAWDDLEEEEGASELQREWDSRRSRFFVHGYREGLEQGKEDALQQGFDEGFALGSRSGFHVGFAQGVYDALIGMQKQGVHHLSEKEKEFIAVMEELPPSDQLHKQILETGDVTVSAFEGRDFTTSCLQSQYLTFLL